MFHFNRKPDTNERLRDRVVDRVMQTYGGRKETKNQRTQQANEARQSVLDEVVSRVMVQSNIATYFNNQRIRNPGYRMTIREKEDAGSKELAAPWDVTDKIISEIQKSDHVFLEGHVRTQQGLIKDVYDSDYPEEIMREKFGRLDTLSIYELESYEEQVKASRPKAGPEARVKRVDDIMDIPIYNSGNGRSL